MNELDIMLESPINLGNMLGREIALGKRPVKWLRLALKRPDFVEHIDGLPLTSWRETFRSARIRDVWYTVGLAFEVFSAHRYRRWLRAHTK